MGCVKSSGIGCFVSGLGAGTEFAMRFVWYGFFIIKMHFYLIFKAARLHQI